MASSASFSSSSPAIGSDHIYHPPAPADLPISPSTCMDIYLFKSVIKEWRKTDDSIIVRINRSAAMNRDEARKATVSASPASASDGGCSAVFRDMVAAWTNRAMMLSYCTDVVDRVAAAAAASSAGPPRREGDLAGKTFGTDEVPTIRAGTRDVGRSEAEVLQQRYANERAVEAIVRQRSLAAFKSRCPFFQPPPEGTEGAKWWSGAEDGSIGVPKLPNTRQ